MGFWDEIKKAAEEGKAKGKEIGSFEYQAKKMEEKRELKRQKKQEEKDRIKELRKHGTPFCPKCKSTSVQYVERRKRLSLGRGIIGGAVSPLAGAVGAMTSKKYKGFVKCLNCGNQWKK